MQASSRSRSSRVLNMFPATGRLPWAFGTANGGTAVTSNSKEYSNFAGVRYTYRFQ
jgi:hypothetical protein